MAKNTISANTISENLGLNNNTEITMDWNGLELVIRQRISQKQMVALAQGVIEGVFSEDGKYVPFLQEYLFKALVITAYSNITLSKDEKVNMQMVYDTDLYYIVTDNACHEQLADIRAAVNNAIEYRITANNSIRGAFADVLQLAGGFLSSIQETFEGLDLDEIKTLIGSINMEG